MTRSLFNKGILFCILWVMVQFASNCFAVVPPPKYQFAFQYSDFPPLDQLKFYPNVVIAPSTYVNPKQFNTSHHTLFAYVSLGEVTSLSQYEDHPIDPRWIIAKNNKWHSLVLDQSNPAWQQFFIQDLITPLWDKGYRAFFLDTVDSYRLASTDPSEMAKQQAGLITIIRTIKAKYPNVKLVTNRGFEIMPEIRPFIDGVIAESLFAGWDNQQKRYRDVTPTARNWLLKELNRVKEMGLPITVVDYLAPKDAGRAVQVAQKITELGFNAWVTDGDLTQIYLSNVKLLPRKILLFYQGERNNIDEKVGSYISKVVTMPLNYMGYITEVRNIYDPLPTDLSSKDIAGIVVGIDGFLIGREQILYDWYLSLLKKQIPFVILNNFGFQLENFNLNPFQLSLPTFSYPPHSVKPSYEASIMNYETHAVARKNDFVPVTLRSGSRIYQQIDEMGTKGDMAAIMPWGGYYLSSSFIEPVPNNNYLWAINPFEFFRQALRLPSRPVPDITTENARRLMFVQIDGDGFANKSMVAQGGFVSEILEHEILEHYALPTTVSIIQGEIAANGLHPELSQRLEKIARRIFSLPHVEIASHTYSHPFNWQSAARHNYRKKHLNPYTLPIPNYHFNIHTEVKGSIDYINQHLAPAGKQCKMFLWSGEGDVPEEALRILADLHIANLNPGMLITRYNPSLTRISAMGINEGPFYQVFAPIGNDDETIAHSSVFYSLIGLIDALKLTETPIRLKPIDLYYHFYSASQLGGLKSLRQVYDWALSQHVMNIYASDYYQKVVDFNQLAIAEVDDGWLFETNDALRELRIPQSMGYPDLERSEHVIGYSAYQGNYYVHLGPGGEALLYLKTQPPTLPYLLESNARVTHFERKPHGIDFSLDGYLDVEVTFDNMASCSLWQHAKAIRPTASVQAKKTYRFKRGMSHELSIQCS